jgi:acyl-CoA synthetase (AMP-forming)/AMP-acid ligase II
MAGPTGGLNLRGSNSSTARSATSSTCAEALPTQEAVEYSGYPEFGHALGLRWTYRQYQDRADQVARSLMALGLHKGDHIAIWAVNVPEWPLLQMAAAKAGLVLVTVNPLLRAVEVEYILKQGDVRALFLMPHIREHDCLHTLHVMSTPGKKRATWRASA